MNKLMKIAGSATAASLALASQAWAVAPTSLTEAATSVDLSDTKSAVYVGIAAVLGIVVVIFGGKRLKSLF